MKKLLIALPLAALLLTGCGSATAPTVDKPSAEKTAVEKVETKTADRSADLGGTVTYDSGVKISVTSLGFEPAGEYVSGAVEGQTAVFELAVENTSDEELDAVLMSMPKVTVGEKNTNTESIIDSENNLGMDMLSTILPGETQTIKFGAGIAAADADTVRVEISGPTYNDKSAIFKGAVK